MNSETVRTAPTVSDALPDELQRFTTGFKKLGSAWKMRRASAPLHLPGKDICIPDFVCTHGETGRKVYLEVMGYWSREAVWRRVDLVERGLKEAVLFAVSERLRVSERSWRMATVVPSMFTRGSCGRRRCSSGLMPWFHDALRSGVHDVGAPSFTYSAEPRAALELPQPSVRGPGFHRGASIGFFLEERDPFFEVSHYSELINRAVSAGATHVQLALRWFQDDVGANEIAPGHGRR